MRRSNFPILLDACKLANLLRTGLLTGGRLIKHACYYWLLLAEGHLTRRLFGAMVRRIGALSLSAG